MDRFATFDPLSVFSYRLNPVRAEFMWNIAQSVRTKKEPESAYPLEAPVAVTICAPGWAVAGIVNLRDALEPEVATALPTVEASNLKVTVSPGVKPLPEAVVEPVGGPKVGLNKSVPLV